MTGNKTEKKVPSICINALFVQEHFDGIGNYCLYLLENLTRQNPTWKFSLLVSKAAAHHFEVLRDRVEILEVNLKSVGSRLLYMHGYFPFKVLRFDLVHSVANIGLIYCPVPQVITVHDAYERVKPERFSGWLKTQQLVVTKALSTRNAARIMVDSRNTLEDMERYYSGLEGKMQVVNLGTKFPVESYTERPRKNFVAQGLLDVGRNLDQILQSYAAFSGKDQHKLILFSVRKNGKEASLPALVDSMGLKDHVEYLGRVPDAELQELYRNALGFIRAQTYDGFGLPVIEAMACGCPALVAHNSSLIEIGGDAALFFETDSVQDLTRQMERLSASPALAQSVSQKSLEHARNFTWEKTALKTGEVYREALSLHGWEPAKAGRTDPRFWPRFWIN